LSGHVKIGLKQHIGAAATPIVAVGESVKKGQLLATCEGLGANVHSSVYGMVDGVCADFVSIIMDAHQPAEFVRIKETDSLLEAVQEAGIVGAGGAGFPAHVKFDVDLGGGTFILNGAECEPILGHNMQVLRKLPELIVRGVKYAMGMVNASRGIIAIKPKHKAEMIAVAKACKDEPSISIKYLADEYPVGDERVIVREVLGVTLKPGQLPVAAGAVVSNVETIKRVALAIEEGMPVITKDFTVCGRLNDLGGEGRVYLDEPIGLPVSRYIEDLGGYIRPVGEIVLGGAFTGTSGSVDSPVTKTLGGIFVALPFPDDNRKFGILACECGAGEARLQEIVEGMGGEVVASAMCKRMVEVNGRYRCEEPGNCPGQSEKILKLKAEGAQAVVVGTCED